MTTAFLTLSINPLSLFSLSWENIDWQATYLLGSFVMTVLVLYEAVSLYRTGGKLSEDSWVHMVSILGVVWLIVSAVALYYVNFERFAMVIPTIFIVYNLFGWGYSMYLVKDDVDFMKIETVEDIVIPKPYIDYSMAFGVVALSSIGALVLYLSSQGRLALAMLGL
ncbi:hypothetical protein MOMA_06726 [Moraxella macacae 0408225]|uniref:Uncharacterized protein n=1 Tax=Moraxella macacae 0408225 TaxID=1230338 RepID=L2F5R1_9GAMM|nr:hypothetical protein [Moraxella macacae]ELA08235.1 hypothetical protein MOMA_06726 [Moraxella macacae 0408225]